MDFGLRDSQGMVWGTMLSHLALSLDPSTDPGGDCASDAGCADFCNNGGATWRDGAPGAATNGGFCVEGSCYCCYAFGLIDPVTGAVSDNRCMACDEGGTNCDWDVNLGCHEDADVCLFFLGS